MWKGRFLNRVGRLKLVNSVRSSIPTYFLTIFNLKKWALKKMHKIRRGFLWKGTDNVSGGHCLVRWALLGTVDQGVETKSMGRSRCVGLCSVQQSAAS
jgi:hypothetical protein